jgi:hypothetical protein
MLVQGMGWISAFPNPDLGILHSSEFQMDPGGFVLFGAFVIVYR